MCCLDLIKIRTWIVNLSDLNIEITVTYMSLPRLLSQQSFEFDVSIRVTINVVFFVLHASESDISETLFKYLDYRCIITSVFCLHRTYLSLYLVPIESHRKKG